LVEPSADAALPAWQDAWLALPLARELRPPRMALPGDELVAVRGDLRVGTEEDRQGSMRRGVPALRQTEDPMQERPMPVTNSVHHMLLTSCELRAKPQMVSWKQ
jgi:hypothetical protein